MSETIPAAGADAGGAAVVPAEGAAAPAVAPAAEPAAPALPTDHTALTGAPEPDAAAEGEGEKPEGDKPKEPEGPTPVEYKDLKLPEGVVPDAPLVAAFVETVAAQGVPQAAAEAAIAALAPKVQEALQAPYKEWERQQTAWLEEINNDPVIGGEKLKPAQAKIAKLLTNQAFVSPGFLQAMLATGAGNHPEVVRTFAKLAEALTEPGMLPTARPPRTMRSVAERHYPNLAER